MEPKYDNRLNAWDLCKSYGHFNILFESLIGLSRDVLIYNARAYYGFDVDWEDPADLEVVSEEFNDRIMKIILHDASASQIVQKCKACFKEFKNPKVKEVLLNNDIQPPEITDFDSIVIDKVFDKLMDLVQLRNVLIHTHFNDPLFYPEFMDEVELKGTKDYKTAKGCTSSN